MELVIEAKNKKVFMDEKGNEYTVLNMGGYVGHNNRQWYENAPEVWRLMDYKNEENGLHIEALVDDRGNYMRLLAEKGKTKRAMQIVNGFVYNDVVLNGKTYTSLDGDIYGSPKFPLNEYLEDTIEFHRGDEVLTDDYANNNDLLYFLQSNEELISIINQSKKSK